MIRFFVFECSEPLLKCTKWRILFPETDKTINSPHGSTRDMKNGFRRSTVRADRGLNNARKVFRWSSHWNNTQLLMSGIFIPKSVFVIVVESSMNRKKISPNSSSYYRNTVVRTWFWFRFHLTCFFSLAVIYAMFFRRRKIYFSPFVSLNRKLNFN